MNISTNAPYEIDADLFHDEAYFHDMESFYCKEFEVACGACETVACGSQDDLERSGWKLSSSHETCPECIGFLEAVQDRANAEADKAAQRREELAAMVSSQMWRRMPLHRQNEVLKQMRASA